MSNALMNYHATHGRPCGDDTIVDIADYYGELLTGLDGLMEKWENIDHYDDLYIAGTLDCLDELRAMLFPKAQMKITQIETDEAWQCPFCGDWFTDGENRCAECDYSPDAGRKE